MTLSRWKMLAGVLGVSLGGLAAVAAQCPKTDTTKGGGPETSKVMPSGPALPALPAAPVTHVPVPDLPALPTTAEKLPALPPLPSKTADALPPAKLPEMPAAPVVIPASGTDTKPLLPPLPSSGDVKPPMPSAPAPDKTPAPPPLDPPMKSTTPSVGDPIILPPGKPTPPPTPPAPDFPPTKGAPTAPDLPPPTRATDPLLDTPPAAKPINVPDGGITSMEIKHGKPAVVSKFRILLRVGEGEPTFEVRCGDDLMLKVTCEKVDITSPPKGNGPSSVKASGKVRFAGFGAEGTCEELSFLAGTGEVSMVGAVKISVKDKLGRIESELSTENAKYKLDPCPAGAAKP